MRVVWSIAAHDQLRQAADFIENRFGKSSRTKFLDNIYHIVPLLRNNPYLGKEEPLLGGASVIYRSLVIGRLNKIVYHINGNSIEIVALWDTRREPKKQSEELK